MFCCHHHEHEPFGSKTDASHDHVTLFKNVKVFDGKSDALEDLEVLVEGNLIKAVGPKLEPGAYADILLVKGNPLENILVLRDYKDNIHLIMKDGKVYKNEL